MNQLDSLFKLNLLLGRTLWGMMLRNNQIALDYLATRSEVDSSTSPPAGIRNLESDVVQIHSLFVARDRFRSILYKNTGHVYLSTGDEGANG